MSVIKEMLSAYEAENMTRLTEQEKKEQGDSRFVFLLTVFYIIDKNTNSLMANLLNLNSALYCTYRNLSMKSYIIKIQKSKFANI